MSSNENLSRRSDGGGGETSFRMGTTISSENSMNSAEALLQNKWVQLVIFVLACFFTSALYYGWQQYQRMLFMDNAYAWLCEGGEQCKAQEDAIGRLYSIAAGCEYASAAFGGILLDHLGPKRTGLIGEVQWGLGTLLLALASHSFQVYIPAMIIIGFSVNIVCFPALTTVESFPTRQGLMVGIALAAQNATTGVPPILYAIMKRTGISFRNIWLGYLACVWVPVTVLYVMALPNARDFKSMLLVQREALLANQHTQDLKEAKRIAETSPHRRDKNAANNSNNNSNNGATDPSFGASPDTCVGSSPLAPAPAPVNEEEILLAGNAVVVAASDIVQGHASWHDFARNIRCIDVLVMSVYFATMMMIYAYYPTVVAYAVGENISDYLAYIMPTQAAWTLFVGVIADHFCTAYIMIGMCVLTELTFILTLIGMHTKTDWLHYLACSILVVSQCAIFEVKYTYVAEMFDPYNFGKLVGFFGVVGGLATFLNIPVAEHPHYTRVFTVYCFVLPLCAFLAACLKYRQSRGVIYKSLPDTKKKAHDV